MTPYQKMIEALHGVQDQRVVGAITAWLRGDRLVDPQAVAFLKQFYPDLAQAGRDAPQGVRAGPVEQPPAAPSTIGSVVAPATGALPGGSATGAPGYGSETQPTPPPPGGGEPPPVRSVPQGGGQATRAAQAGQAAGGLAAAWMANRSPVAAPMNPVPTPSAAPTQQTPQAAGGSTMSGVIPGGGGSSAGGGEALAGGTSSMGNDFRMNQALQAAGVDPYSRGLRTQYLKQLLGKSLAARGSMLGLEGNGADPTTYLDTLKNMVLSFITPGRNGVAEQRALAQNIQGNPGFGSVLGNLDTPGQSQMYQNLLQMEYGFENPAVQSAAQNVFGDTMGHYMDDTVGSATPFKGPSGQGLFSEYAQQDPKSTIARILAGLYGR